MAEHLGLALVVVVLLVAARLALGCVDELAAARCLRRAAAGLAAAESAAACRCCALSCGQEFTALDTFLSASVERLG